MQHSKKMLEEMSWVEFEEKVKSVHTMLVPMGSVEVEGPHLPLNVDSLVAEEIARRVCDATDGTMVAPLMNVTYSDWHLGFPGTLTFEMKTFMTMVEEFCLSLVKHGVKRVFFVNSHVGNDPAIWYVANKFSIQGLLRVGQINLWALSTEVGQGIEELKEKSFMHAGEIMTSVVMAIRPDLVNMEAAQKEYLKPLTDGYQTILSSKTKVDGISTNFYHASRELTQSGVMGDPSEASAEKGEKILQEMVRRVGKVVRSFGELPIPKAV